ncbi:hypothetical protein [Pedobacter sp. ASV12]|uniref:hypothetical protein n=1 Tax=Pedobacter sp. ASV12 TaxID=2795120 RepID=UPI0018EB7B7A|nr:hypothetical protein [Pedobacter sp. ASV12]
MKKSSLFILILASAVALYFITKNIYVGHKTYVTPINSHIDSISFANRGGVMYYYKGGQFIGDFFFKGRDSAFLKVGDSVSKKSKSYVLKAYRRNSSGNLVYYRTFTND